jgi:hypothetical protein
VFTFWIVGAIPRLRGPLHPLFGEPARRRRALWLLAAGTLVFGLAQAPFLGTMSHHGTGVISFELARTPARAHEIVTEWGSAGRSAARWSLIFDYPYLVCYGLLLCGACTAVADRWRRLGNPRLAELGLPLAWAGLVAAGFDALENVALLLVAGGHTGQPWPELAADFASVKFALSIAATAYALVGWLVTALRGRRRAAT